LLRVLDGRSHFRLGGSRRTPIRKLKLYRSPDRVGRTPRSVADALVGCRA
jgi:hypothetical protein